MHSFAGFRRFIFIRLITVALILAFIWTTASAGLALRSLNRESPNGDHGQTVAPVEMDKANKEEIRPAAMAGKSAEDAGPKKKFPWLIVAGAVVVAGGVLALWLTKKTTSTPSTGSISVSSNPTGAEIYLDGIDTGRRTDTTLENISTGAHNLRLELENYGKWEGSVNVIAGQTANVSATLAANQYEFVLKWGNQGNGDGQFNYPWGMAVDLSGNVYVADTTNDRIQKFTSGGIFMTKWGSQGSGDGQFSAPRGIAVDSSGDVYVSDNSDHRIQKFTSSGSFVTKWGSYGSDDGQFYAPEGVAADPSGYIYVADRGNQRIQKFTSSGSFVTKWGSYGGGDGQFNLPFGVASDSSGNIYVAESANHRIQKFTSSGSFVTKWGSYGGGDGQFNYPFGVEVDSSGHIFIADFFNHRIQEFTSDGSFVTKWGSYGGGDGQFSNPCDVVVDSAGYVYVVDRSNHRVQKFRFVAQTMQPAQMTYIPIAHPFAIHGTLMEKPSLKGMPRKQREFQKQTDRNDILRK